MINKIIKISKIIVSLFAAVTFLFSIKTWLQLPDVIPVHFDLSHNPDRYGDKIELLVIAFFPLLGLIPWKSKEKTYHCNDEETKKRAEEEHNKAVMKDNIFQIVISIILCEATWYFIKIYYLY